MFESGISVILTIFIIIYFDESSTWVYMSLVENYDTNIDWTK